MKNKTITNMLVAAALALCLPSCNTKNPESTSTQGIATIACDATFENILSQEIDVFEYIYPKASIMPYYVDEHAAIDSLLQFKSKIAIATRTLNQKEVEYCKSHKKNVRQTMIAVDAIALIVNPANKTEILSKGEIAEMLIGKVTDWSQVTPGMKGGIKVVFDHQGSSTARYMRDSLLNNEPFAPNVYAQKTPQAVFDAVAADKNAIGVIGVSWITSDMRSRELTREEMTREVNDSLNNSTQNLKFSEAVKVLKVRRDDEVTAFKPYQLYISTGEYPLYRQVYLITTAPKGTLTSGFYSFITGFEGQKIIMLTGILPRVVRPQMVEVN